jgi:phage terminase large subunit
MILNPEMPEKLEPILYPARYKIARGGRGSAKSWTFARTLLALGAIKQMRILCAREIQRSIKDSVHKLLSDQCKRLNLEQFYRVLETSIHGANGTEFTFTGLSVHTVATMKSYEGYDICWVEEGQVLSKRSYDILIPTIRKDGSEIWISYNPELETDETHQRFTLNPPDDCLNIEVNWRDNPWFNQVLNKERLHCKRTDPDNYDNIWEGKCKPAVEGAIYFKEIQSVEIQNRIFNLPYDPMLKVHLVFDLGWEDSLAVALVQKYLSEIRVIEYLEVNHTALSVLSNQLKTRPYNWGKVWLPHDGFAASLNSNGKSTFDILVALGWNVVIEEEITKMSVEEGIRNVRLKFPQMYFDKTKCHAAKSPELDIIDYHPTDLNWRLIECLKRYRRQINQQTDAAGKPVREKHAHGADTLRYVAVNADNMHNEEERQIIIPNLNYAPLDAGVGM